MNRLVHHLGYELLGGARHRHRHHRHRYRRGHGYGIVFYPVDPYGYRHYGHILQYSDLVALLGHIAVERLVYELLGPGGYGTHRLTGRWHDARHHSYHGTAYYETGYRGLGYEDGRALQLFLEGRRVAELADFDRDGRVDLLLTRR